ncbi:MAG: hypothetical protein SNJ82_02995 [Gemmataceae bacterium]
MCLEFRNLLGWTLDDALPLLADWELCPEPRSAEHTQRETIYFRLESAGWRAAQGKLCVRYTRVCSAKVDIATLMIYPTAGAARLPIFGAEWVVVGCHCTRLVLDVEPAAAHLPVSRQLGEHFAKLGQRWQNVFPTDANMAQWFASIAQPWALHSACAVEQLPLLRQAYREYLQAYINLVNLILPKVPSGADTPEVAAYKRHHAEHSPGKPLMDRVFGPEWTHRFLHETHFGVIQESSADSSLAVGGDTWLEAAPGVSPSSSSSPAARAY